MPTDLADEATPPTHDYLSTACWHGLHDQCRQGCKYCGAPCHCPHHHGEYEPNPHPWDVLAGIVEWMDADLDGQVATAYKEQPLAQDWARVTKVGEEAGEVIDAFIGATGQNPRKGTYGSMEDVYAELADVSLAALYALCHFTKDAPAALDRLVARARFHRQRREAQLPPAQGSPAGEAAEDG